MIYLNIGEPDFTAPPLVVEAAAQRAIRDGQTQYTPTTGLPALRERISDWYAARFGLRVPVPPDGAFYAWADCTAACDKFFVAGLPQDKKRPPRGAAHHAQRKSVGVFSTARSEYNSAMRSPGQTPGSWEFTFELMQRARLATTPGRDFGHAGTARHIRFSTANSMPQLQAAIARLREVLD